MAENIWVVVHGDQWAVRRQNNDQPIQITRDQEDAIEAGRKLAKQEGVELLIQGEDGMFRDRSG